MKVFDRYYELLDKVHAYKLAYIFNPSIKIRAFQEIWKIKSSAKLEELKGVYEKWKLAHCNSESERPKSSRQPQSQVEKAFANNHWFLYTNISNEWDAYVNTPIIPEKELDPLQWWLKDESQERYPTLSKFALSILSLPVMSDAPERGFSSARRQIT